MIGVRTAMGLLAALLAGQVVAAEPPVAVPVDQAARLGSVDVACTGFGRAMRDDPRWRAYGVRVEFSNRRNEYLAGAMVTVRDGAARTVASATCDPPWFLMRLSPGRYKIEAQLVGAAAGTRGASFDAPAKGQLRVVLPFPDAS